MLYRIKYNLYSKEGFDDNELQCNCTMYVYVSILSKIYLLIGQLH